MERIAEKTVIVPDVIEEADNLTLVNEYLEDAKCMGLTDKTIENYRSCLKIFSNIMEKSLLDVDIPDLKGFKVHLENSKNRYN